MGDDQDEEQPEEYTKNRLVAGGQALRTLERWAKDRAPRGRASPSRIRTMSGVPSWL